MQTPKIQLEARHLPVIESVDSGYKLNYGPSRGYQIFESKQEAEQIMYSFVSNRIHSLARELDDLCKLQRRILEFNQDN